MGWGRERVGGGFWTFIGNCDNRIFGLFYGKMWEGLGRRVRKACIYAFMHTE